MTTIEKILDLIANSGKSDYELRRAIELTNSNISEWRAGRAKASTEAIVKIARYFNVTTDYLLGLAEEKPKYQFFFESLSPDNQVVALGFLEDLLKKQESDIKKVISAVKKATKP